jgi:CHAT domain
MMNRHQATHAALPTAMALILSACLPLASGARDANDFICDGPECVSKRWVGPRLPQDRTVALHRYPLLEGPTAVAPGAKLDVVVGLSVTGPSTGLTLVVGDSDDAGALVLHLPETPERRWALDVTLSAPAFEHEGAPQQHLELSADDTENRTVTFSLRAGRSAGSHPINAVFSYQGNYLAQVAREITIGEQPSTKTTQIAPVSVGPITTASSEPDLTVVETRDGDIASYVLLSPHLQPIGGLEHKPIDPHVYDLGFTTFMLARGGAPGSGVVPSKDERIALMKDFGNRLWNEYTDPKLREVFWLLRDKLGDRFRSIQIITNNPAMPWELLKPQRSSYVFFKEDTEFWGIDYDLARWHLNTSSLLYGRPAREAPVGAVQVIAPAYTGPAYLPAQGSELAALRALPGFKSVGGSWTAVSSLLNTKPSGIIHFAGHGVVDQTQGHFSIVLEDRELDLSLWQNVHAHLDGSFLFFNACDVGASTAVRGLVVGWAPAALESGATGYVGGLWPLGDTAAAEFSTRFYKGLFAQLSAQGYARAATLFRETRRGFYETGDPTYLAYVYYGDPNFSFTREAK